MKKLLTLLVFLFSLSSLAQEGTPFMSHFDGAGANDIQNWSLCQDDQGVMYFANRQGLLTFDGNSWKNIRLTSTPITIEKDEFSESIFVGCKNSFGYMERDIRGKVTYNRISPDTTDPGIITGIIFNKDLILFFGESSVSIYDREKKMVTKQWFSGKDKYYSGVTYINDKLYINIPGSGLHRLDSDTLFPIVTGYLTENTEILFSLPFSANRVLIGTSDNRLSLFDGIKYYDYPLSNKEYLFENILNSAIIVDEERYAFSTLYGGALVVEKTTGEVEHTINYQNGLPDDEVYALGSDNNSGLWLTHPYGISRVELKLPVRSYSIFPGLEGFPVNSIVFKDRLYVATNTGLFILDEVKNYTEIEVFYKVNQERKAESIQKVQEEEPIVQEQKRPIKNAFSRLFAKRDRKGEAAETAKPEEVKQAEEPIPQKQSQPVYRKRTVSKLLSVNWMYRKIEGINTRCDELLKTDNGLLVVSGTGLHLVNEKEAIMLTEDRGIYDVLPSGRSFIIGSEDGLYSVSESNGVWVKDKSVFNHKTPVFSVTGLYTNEIWAGGSNTIYCFEQIDESHYREKGWYYYDSEFQEDCILDVINDTLYHFAEGEILYFSNEEENFLPYISDSENQGGKMLSNYMLNQKGRPWVRFGSDWVLLSGRRQEFSATGKILRLFDNVSTINIDDAGSFWVIDDDEGIYKIDLSHEIDSADMFNLFVSGISNEEGINLDITNLILEEGEPIFINLSAPHYLKESSTEYQYFTEGFNKTWSPWTTNPLISQGLTSGDYTMRLRARNILGLVTEEKTIDIYIKPPFTKTGWFYALIAIAALALLLFLSNLRQRKLRHDKKILEEKVKERTIEIENKKEQIEVQRDEILKQKEEITSSITYARRIQEAILPDYKMLKKNFTDHFILYKPRDIVSGDFYWLAEGKDFVYFAVADCTGHGVPGAIMSMLGISFLNEITGEGSIDIHTGEILDILRDKIISALHHSGRDSQSNDGMDITLCKYLRKDKIVEFSGAFNPLYQFRSNKLIEHKADRMPIGYFEKSTTFETTSIKIKKGDTLYLFSDGYYDQFGGPNDKKFSSKNLRITLTGIVDMPLHKQAQFLEDRFNEWKGSADQVDDIIIAGIRF